MLRADNREGQGGVAIEKEYMTLDEAALFVGCDKNLLYYYIRKLALQTHKFPLNKRAYLASGDVEKIKVVRTEPWKV